MTAIGWLKADPARSSRQSEPQCHLVLTDQGAPATASYMGSASTGAPITPELAGFCAAPWLEFAPPLTAMIHRESRHVAAITYGRMGGPGRREIGRLVAEPYALEFAFLPHA